MSEDNSDTPDGPPAPPRRPLPTECLFEFYREHDHTRWRCDLRHHPDPYGVEALFFLNEEFIESRRFGALMDPTQTPREMAVAWALEERKAIESDIEEPTR